MLFRENSQNGGPYNSQMRIVLSKLKEEYDFVIYFVPRIRDIIKPRRFVKICKDIRSINPDIVQFSGLQAEGFFLLLLSKISSKAKNICAVRGKSSDAVYTNKFAKWLSTKLELWTLRNSDIIYGVSNYVCSWKELTRFSKKLYGTIYNFYDYDKSICDNSEIQRIKSELNIKLSDVVIISTGRITLEKGYGDLLLIAKEILGSIDNIKFLIVGNGSYLEQMKTEMRRYGYKDRVIFYGYSNDVGRLLDISDIFITCSWHETFGNSIVEASNHGLPIVASKVGGIPEIVQNKKTGFLVEKGDIDGFVRALKDLAENPELRVAMGKKGLLFVNEKFNQTRIENCFRELYERVLKENV